MVPDLPIMVNNYVIYLFIFCFPKQSCDLDLKQIGLDQPH